VYKYYNFNHVVDTENDECLIYYDCSADSTISSYITNCCDVFTTYETVENLAVSGIGGKGAHVCGRGTITLESHCAGRTYLIAAKHSTCPQNKKKQSYFLRSMGSKWPSLYWKIRQVIEQHI
jgi:hypothetical protein